MFGYTIIKKEILNNLKRELQSCKNEIFNKNKTIGGYLNDIELLKKTLSNQKHKSDQEYVKLYKINQKLMKDSK